MLHIGLQYGAIDVSKSIVDQWTEATKLTKAWEQSSIRQMTKGPDSRSIRAFVCDHMNKSRQREAHDAAKRKRDQMIVDAGRRHPRLMDWLNRRVRSLQKQRQRIIDSQGVTPESLVEIKRVASKLSAYKEIRDMIINNEL